MLKASNVLIKNYICACQAPISHKPMKGKSKKDRLIDLVESLSRPGTHAVVELIKNSNFASKFGGASHHRYRGGLVDHSLEVYEHMKEKATGLDIPEESIIICSLFHDLGKLNGHKGHPAGSLAILDQCGFELTPEERQAIATHHKIDGALDMDSLQSLLKRSDMLSTGEWQKKHPQPNTSLWKSLIKSVMGGYSKC